MLKKKINSILAKHAPATYAVMKDGWEEDGAGIIHKSDTDEGHNAHKDAAEVLYKHNIIVDHKFSVAGGSSLRICAIPRNQVMCASLIDTIAVNIDNNKLSDAEFRQFVRNSLPVTEA